MNGLAEDLARALDPVALALRVGHEPYEWQERILRSKSNRLALLCPRQSGKTTLVAILALHRAIYRPGALVLILAPSLRQSQLLFEKCLAYYRAVGRPEPSEAENQLSLTLETGSRIVSLPGQGSTIRGYSAADLLVVDEAAYFEDDGDYLSVLPALASSGREILLSTPRGRRGFFFELWTSGSHWERVNVTTADCPHLTEEKLDRELGAMGEFRFREEYGFEEGPEFLDPEGQVIASEYIEKAFDPNLEPWSWLSAQEPLWSP